MMKINVQVSPEDVEILGLANKRFGDGDKHSATKLVEWAVDIAVNSYCQVK